MPNSLGNPRLRYADLILSEYPYAMNRYFNNLQYQQQQRALGQQDEALKQQQEQFNTNLSLSKEQFKQQQEQIKQQQEQNNMANTLAEIGLGFEAYPYLKSGAKAFYPALESGVKKIYGLGESLFGSAEAPAEATSLGPEGLFAGTEPAVYSEADIAGLGPEMGFEGAEGAPAAAPSMGPNALKLGGYVAAAIALQHMLAGGTDTVYEGHRTGDVFSGDLFNDPWQGYVANRLGTGPTAGEKLDAAIANRDYGKAFLRGPAAVEQWAAPGINLIGDASSTYAKQLTGGNDLAGALAKSFTNPIGATTDFLESIGIGGGAKERPRRRAYKQWLTEKYGYVPKNNLGLLGQEKDWIDFNKEIYGIDLTENIANAKEWNAKRQEDEARQNEMLAARNAEWSLT